MKASSNDGFFQRVVYPLVLGEEIGGSGMEIFMLAFFGGGTSRVLEVGVVV